MTGVHRFGLQRFHIVDCPLKLLRRGIEKMKAVTAVAEILESTGALRAVARQAFQRAVRPPGPLTVDPALGSTLMTERKAG